MFTSCRPSHIPDSATSAMGTPCSCAMNPNTEKTANPATKLVALFNKHSNRQSLQTREGAKTSVECFWWRGFQPSSGVSSCLVLTCSSCYCMGCSCLVQSRYQHPHCMKRKFGPQPPSKPVETKHEWVDPNSPLLETLHWPPAGPERRRSVWCQASGKTEPLQEPQEEWVLGPGGWATSHRGRWQKNTPPETKKRLFTFHRQHVYYRWSSSSKIPFL